MHKRRQNTLHPHLSYRLSYTGSVHGDNDTIVSKMLNVKALTMIVQNFTRPSQIIREESVRPLVL